jgi:uncharacterized protein YlxP (DUF503 family)
MIVGVARFRLRLPENSSLKGKRGVVKSLCARIQGEFRVAAAEVDEQDVWQIAEIGVACVSNDRRHADAVLDRVLRFVESTRLDLELLDVETELIDV